VTLVRITVIGVPNFQARLCCCRSRETALDTVRALGEAVEEEAKRLVPVLTGDLRTRSPRQRTKVLPTRSTPSWSSTEGRTTRCRSLHASCSRHGGADAGTMERKAVMDRAKLEEALFDYLSNDPESQLVEPASSRRAFQNQASFLHRVEPDRAAASNLRSLRRLRRFHYRSSADRFMG
jgi:hypothetical protein